MAQKRDWIKTQYAGVRYREHPTRKHNRVPDRYFAIRYKIAGKPKEEGLGWASDGWNPLKASNLRGELLENQRRGEGPTSLEQKRGIANKKQQEQQEAEKKKITFKKASEIFLSWAKLNKRDWCHDESRLKHYSHLINDKLLTEITTADIEQVKTHCQEKGLSPASVKHCLTLIRAIYNHCIRLDLFQGTNPTKNVKMPQKDNRRLRFLTFDESELLLDALWERSLDVHDQALLSLHTGLRAGEIFALRWDHVDFENNIINILGSREGETKSGFSRQAYMTERVEGMLLRRYQDKQKGLIFESRVGGQHRDISDTFRRTVKALKFNEGVEDPRQQVCFHSLRHTFASWLALQGEALLTIKELMGHKTIEMTMRYAHLIPDQKRAAVDKLGQRSNGKVVSMEEARQRKTG